MFGASAGDAAEVGRDLQGLSLMTRCLIQSLQHATGTLSIDQAYQNVSQAIEAQAQGKTAAGNRPMLINGCSQPALLKP